MKGVYKMKKEFDLKLIEDSVKNILIALGEDPTREGIVDTPKRVAKMYDEVFEGMKYNIIK
jgi:GTP cyclohydrolase I